MTHDFGLRLNRRAVLAGIGALMFAAGTRLALAEDAKIQLGFVYWETKTDAFVQMANGGKAVAALDPRVIVQTAAPDSGDPQRQVALFGPIAQTQVDGIVLQSLASGPLTRPVMDAIAAGIPVVAIDAPPPDGSGVGLFITADNVGLGAELAEKVLALVAGGTGAAMAVWSWMWRVARSSPRACRCHIRPGCTTGGCGC